MNIPIFLFQINKNHIPIYNKITNHTLLLYLHFQIYLIFQVYFFTLSKFIIFKLDMKIDKKILWIVYAACAMEIDVNIFMKIITYG